MRVVDRHLTRQWICGFEHCRHKTAEERFGKIREAGCYETGIWIFLALSMYLDNLFATILSSLARDLASHSTLWYQRIMVAWHPSSLQPKRRLANNQRNPHKTIGFLNLSNTVDTIIHVHAEKSGFFNCNCKGKGKEGNSGEWIGMHGQIYIYYNQHQEFKLFKIMRNLVAVART